MPGRTTYTLSELIAQCDPQAPIPPEWRDWEQMVPVGREELDSRLEPTSNSD